MRKLLAGAAVAMAVAAIAGTVSAAGGPPPFLTFPILMHVGEDGLDHGHFVFTEGAAIPGPLAKDYGTANAPNADFTLGSLSPSNDTNVSGGTSEYEGETGAAATGGYLVGAANHIFPGA